jgi:uncharacterized repeat protein (TIGR03803 family)
MSAQTFTTLHSFDLTDGDDPVGALVQATNGNLYGTTDAGAGNCAGTVFEITTGGVLTTLRCFESTDGSGPRAALVQAPNGNFYGTTYGGGTNNFGTVFEIAPSGTLTTLHSFCSQRNSQGSCADGASSHAGLVQGTTGDFYGTTVGGGASGNGTVFKITPSGELTTLHSFCSKSCTDGEEPTSGLVQATNGDLYGTTVTGGASGYGTVFKITPSGELTTLHSFDGTDGANPYAGLVQDSNGDFYGTTTGGGAGNYGKVFKITPSGALTVLHSFDGADGVNPDAGLVQGTDGNFYGTTYGGGANNFGTIFEMTLSGTLTTLHGFDGTDGDHLDAGLVQDTNGDFYGTTSGGGANNYGTVFSLSVGLGPFVETQTTLGKVGAAVKILGTNLTGATSVTFNGTGAVFRVVSSSEITTTVPTGATTGKIKVGTPSGTLSSNQVFRVIP